MNASHGFFTLQCKDMDILEKFLSNHENFGNFKRENDLLIAYLKEPLEGDELNKQLLEKGIFLSYLVHRKESLEEQFLEITKNQN